MGESCTYVQEVTRFEPCNSYFLCQKNNIEAKQGRKAQLERVMHKRARGHEVEHRHSHFLCPKTKDTKPRAFMCLIRNIMGRYVHISSFFVQKCGREKRNVRLF